MTRRNPDATRALEAMRTMIASGWTSERLLVDHAAEVLGGTDDAKLLAQRVFNDKFRIMGSV